MAAERAELLSILAEDADDNVRERAANSLLSQPLEGFVTALQGDAPAAQLFRHCGNNLIDKPEIATALVKHWRCPPQFLSAAAKRLPTSAVQELLLDLDRLSAQPALVGALLQSASLTALQRQELEELLREDPEPETAFADAAESEADAARRVTLVQRLMRMRVVDRVQLALKGNREERLALIHDPCKVVQRGVLQSARITEREVEAFASMANLSEDTLRVIAMNRKYCKNYVVVRNLTNNPKTPIDVTLHFLPHIIEKDLKVLTMNKNVSETLRNAAMRLKRQRDLARKPE